MSGSMSVHPGELDAASGRVLGLVDTAKSTASGVGQSLAQMAGAAGAPDLAGLLAQVTDAATKAMLDSAALLGFVGQNLKQTASDYDKTEQSNTQQIHNAGGANSSSIPGDPDALLRLPNELDGHAGTVGQLSSDSAAYSAQARTNANWSGGAADAYTGFTNGVSPGVAGIPGPLTNVASAIRDYAGTVCGSAMCGTRMPTGGAVLPGVPDLLGPVGGRVVDAGRAGSA